MDELYRISTNNIIEKTSLIFLLSNLMMVTIIYLFAHSNVLSTRDSKKTHDFNDILSDKSYIDEIENRFNYRMLNIVPYTHSNPSLDKNYDLRKIKLYENLSSHSFIGKWKTNEKLFNFVNDEGKIRIAFQHAFGKDDQLMFYSFLIMISDGEINNDWIVIRNNYLISLWNNNITQFDVIMTDDLTDATEDTDYISTRHHNYTALSRFTVPSGLISFKKFNFVFETLFNINFTASFNCDINGKNLSPNYKIIGTLNSNVIDVKFEVEAEHDGTIFSKISKFSLILSFMGLLQLFNYKHLIEKFSQNENSALKYSSNMILINSVWNLFICYITFYISVFDERLFNDFIIPAIIYFIVFNGLEIKIISSIWRAEIFRDETADYSARLRNFRNKLMKFYLLFYTTSILIFFYALQIFFWDSFIISMAVITWLPQIIKNFMNGRRKKIDIVTIILISMNKLFLPLYFKLCPSNFMNMEQDQLTSWLIISIILVQILILFLQRIFGMRCLIPRYFIKERKCNYYQTLNHLKKMKFDLENLNCSICLGPFIVKEETKLDSIQPTPITISDTNKIESGEDLMIKHEDRFLCIRKCFTCLKHTKESSKLCLHNCIRICDGEKAETGYMLTPCNHLFHSNCLKGWIELKNSCPQCRRTLDNLDL